MGLNFFKKASLLAYSAVTAALLTACGGGSSSSSAPAPTTLSGTAAIGDPIVAGTVNVSCASGSPLTTTTTSTGTWTVTVAGQTAPCALQVSGGTVGGVANTVPYHSIAVSFGTVNITPLTDLIVAQLAGTSPQTWFASPTLNTVDAAKINAALTTINTQLGLTSTLGTLDPLTTSFDAQPGNKLDDVLEALKTALGTQSRTYADLLAAAAAGNFTTFSGFGSAFSTAYITVTNTGGGSGTGTGTGTGGTGNYTLTLDIVASGIGSTVVVKDVAKPGNESEFCSEVNNGSTLSSLTAAGGTLTINSCSFSGNVGNISATVAMTSPVSISLPYTVTYTYN